MTSRPMCFKLITLLWVVVLFHSANSVVVEAEDLLNTPVPPAPSAQPESLELGKLTVEQLDSFVDSIRSSIQFQLPPSIQSQRVDANLAGLWAGSSVKVTSDIRQIVLRFRRRTEDMIAATESAEIDPNALLESFDVTIDPSERWLSFVHSHPETKIDVDGFRVRADRPARESLSPFVRGQRDSGMYFVIPPFADASKLWGVLVCPRRIAKARLPGGLSGVALHSSPYELSEVMFTSEGRADVVMSTAGQQGKAEVVLRTTQGVPASIFPMDKSVSTLPRAALHYKPVMPADFFRFAPHDNVQQGMQFDVSLTSKSGYQRSQHFRQAIYLQKFTEPPPITVVADGKRVASDEGDCYMVIDHTFDWTEYSKLPAEKALE